MPDRAKSLKQSAAPYLRVGFAGSPEFAASILQSLCATAFRPVVVYTQPDRPKGRGRKVIANPVKLSAQSLGIEIEQPNSLKGDEARAILANHQLDILIVAAYGLILPQAILDIPTYGCVNVHASLLPRWRGAAPIERAILAGDKETGVCIMQMEKGLDTGPIFASQSCPISLSGSPIELEAQLAQMGSEHLLSLLEYLHGHRALPQALPQNDDFATYAHKLAPLDRQIDWTKDTILLQRQIWGLSARQPVRCRMHDTGMQFLNSKMLESAEPELTQQNLDKPEPGTILGISKAGLSIQCATTPLLITQLKVEKGKGTLQTPAQAMNGYPDLFKPGSKFVAY